jgi:hypothetical protein
MDEQKCISVTYDMCNADDDIDEDCEMAFRGVKAIGAKAEADATNKAVAAIESFMLF